MPVLSYSFLLLKDGLSEPVLDKQASKQTNEMRIYYIHHIHQKRTKQYEDRKREKVIISMVVVIVAIQITIVWLWVEHNNYQMYPW